MKMKVIQKRWKSKNQKWEEKKVWNDTAVNDGVENTRIDKNFLKYTPCKN